MLAPFIRQAVSPHLSLVIPAFNEERRLPACIQAVTEFSALLPYAHETLIVVEPSCDRTLELAHELTAPHSTMAVITNPEHRGKGSAVRRGMLTARGAHVFYMDADMSVPLREVHSFLRHFDAHPEIDLLIGNRQHTQSRIARRQSFVRRRLGGIFNVILRQYGIAQLHDTQCGFKAFRYAAGRSIFARQTLDGFAFDVEVLLLANELGFRVADLPVEWVNSPESRVRIVRDSLAMLRDASRLRRRFGKRP